MSIKYFNELLGFEDEDEEDVNIDMNPSLNFNFANTTDPSSFVKNLKFSNNPEKSIAMFKKGTTTLGFKFQGGILIAVDSRASMGTYNSSEGVQKVIHINDYMIGTMAGGAADCQFWEENLARILKLYELNNGERISISGASQLFCSMLFQYRGYGLSVGTMIAGMDKDGQHLYYCDNDGNRIKGDRFTIGSGGTYAYGVLDTYYRYDLTLDEAVTLGKRAISEATYMDSGSGGGVNVYLVSDKGWKRLVTFEDNNELVWKHKLKNNVNFLDMKLIN